MDKGKKIVKKPKPLKMKLPRVSIPWREVTNIDNIIREQFKNVKIFTGKAEYSDLSEVLDYVYHNFKTNIFRKKRKLDDLTIEAYKPFSFKLELNKNGSKITCDRDDSYARLISYQIQNILNRYDVSALRSRLHVVLPALFIILGLLFFIWGKYSESVKKISWYEISGTIASFLAFISQFLALYFDKPVVDMSDAMIFRNYDMKKNLSNQPVIEPSLK